MRWLLLCLVTITICLLRPALVCADEQGGSGTFPYVAYVSADEARVHAGPGNAYYGTDVLSRGMKVEVLREISGWLAIRPPLGSFSWLPAREAELTDEPDVAMILADDVPAWIGTRIERDADHVWQVQLNQGDHVKVLDTKRRVSAARKAPESWYRIEPPEGEMRFIRAEDVSREQQQPRELAVVEEPAAAASESQPSPTKPAANETIAATSKDSLDEMPSDEEEPSADSSEESSVLKAQFVPRDSTKSRSPTISAPAATSTADKSSPFKDLGASADIGSPRVASLDRLPALDPTAMLSASSRFDDKITDIELQLSLMAARDPRDWQLEPLRAQAEQLVASGQTTLERGRARLVLDKIAQFDGLYVKAVELKDLSRTARVTSVTESMVNSSATSPAASTKPAALTVPEGVTYDGVGWLKPVYSAKRVAPPYALVDVDGKVLQYVTPAPGLNLNRYVKKPVGIFGQKSHLSAFNASHLTAAKVIDLSKYQK